MKWCIRPEDIPPYPRALDARFNPVTFRDIPGFPGYAVDSVWVLWSCRLVGSPPPKWRPLYSIVRKLAYPSKFNFVLRRDGKSHSFTPAKFLRLLAESGFSVERLEALNLSKMKG